MTKVQFSTIYEDSYKVIRESTKWLNSNVGDYQWAWTYWRIGSVTAWIEGVDFVNPEDAIAFKLMFSL